jgi:hypothetical protein
MKQQPDKHSITESSRGSTTIVRIKVASDSKRDESIELVLVVSSNHPKKMKGKSLAHDSEKKYV